MKKRMNKIGVAVLAVCVVLGASSAPAFAQDYPTTNPSGVVIYEFSAADRAAAAAALAAERAAAAAAAAAAGDEVLGISQEAGGLALTGGSVSVPALAGASMIGLGGMIMLAARKRRSSHS